MKYFNIFCKHIIKNNRPKQLLRGYLKHILTIITLPVLLFNITFVILFTFSYNNNVNTHIRSTAEKNAGIIDNLFHSIDTYYKNCLSDNDIVLLLNNSIFINNMSGMSPVDNASYDAKNLNNYLNCINAIYLYSKNNDYIYGLYGQAPAKFDKLTDKSWYDEYLRTGSSNYVALLGNDNNKYLTFCYNLCEKSQNPGVLIIKIYQKDLIRQFNLINNSSESLRLISDISNSDLLYYNAESEIKVPSFEIGLSNYPATLIYSSSADATLFRHFSKVLLLILFIVVIIILTVILAFVFSHKQYKSVLSVISAIEDPYINSFNEASKLYSIIEKNDSAITLHSFEDELLEKITYLKKGQFIALQTQINPHFMFNTLYMISSSIAEKNKNDTDSVNMIVLLSDILRYSLKTDRYIVTVKEETDVLHSYVKILELRLCNAFSVEWNISETVYPQYTLKALLQPLIENSVEHGIQPLYGKRHGKISINIYTENNLLYLNITDNGIGMTPEKLSGLTATLENDLIFRSENVGLKNTVSRIKLLFGNKAGFKITSAPEHTSITIYHPIINDI